MVIELKATSGETTALVETVELNTGGIKTQLKDLDATVKLSFRAQTAGLALKLSLLAESVEQGNVLVLAALTQEIALLVNILGAGFSDQKRSSEF